MMNRLEPLFQNGIGRQKGMPKSVVETHPDCPNSVAKWDKITDAKAIL